MPAPPIQSDATLLLRRVSAGDGRAAEELLPLVYAELRALAASFFGSPAPSHTLQPTALVHEAYVKLVKSPTQDWEGRRHFFEVAAKAMRQILINHARDKRAQKRGGGNAAGRHQITLGDASGDAEAKTPAAVDMLALEEALAGLEASYPQQCRIVELKFFCGLTNEQIALAIGAPLRTVEREWRMAKAELRLRMTEASAVEPAEADRGDRA